jgi:hypothetical protein
MFGICVIGAYLEFVICYLDFSSYTFSTIPFFQSFILYPLSLILICKGLNHFFTLQKRLNPRHHSGIIGMAVQLKEKKGLSRSLFHIVPDI